MTGAACGGVGADRFTLSTADLDVVVDAGRGADVLTVRDRGSGVNVLFSSPWRSRADAIRRGVPPTSPEPTAAWLEAYRGGWQLLCPNAGPPRSVHCAPVGFHGEASVARWAVRNHGDDRASLALELFSLPLTIERVVAVHGPAVTVTDRLTNVSSVPLRPDYVQHPAFGGTFLDGRVTVTTNAATFTADPDRDTELAPGATSAWPHAAALTGPPVDLSILPPAPSRREAFGWLSGFPDVASAQIANLDLGIRVDLTWNATQLPFAWFWLELEATDAFPWYRRARALAIEPASCRTGGQDRTSVLELEAGASIELSTTLALSAV